LNRIHPKKTDTFVLDFRNDTDDIRKAFTPWFERTAAIPTDPNLLWDVHRDLMGHEVIHPDEIGPAVVELLAGKNVMVELGVCGSRRSRTGVSGHPGQLCRVSSRTAR
jgi:hypothetical protein